MTPGKELIRLPSPLLRDLRSAWAKGERVALVLTEGAGRRIEGHVRAVSPTGASVSVNGTLVPLADVLSVHRPRQFMGGETTWRPGERFAGPERRYEPQCERLPNPEGWPA